MTPKELAEKVRSILLAMKHEPNKWRKEGHWDDYMDLCNEHPEEILSALELAAKAKAEK